MRKLMVDHFFHCDDVEQTFFTLIKVEDDGIVDLCDIFKEEVQLILDLTTKPNSMIEFVEQNQVDEPIAMIDIIMPIDIEDKKGILKEDLVAKIQLNDENIE